MVRSFGFRIALALGLVTFLSQTLAGTAQALVAAQAEVGKRTGKFGSDPKSNVTATELQLTAQVDPIPLVPIGFGLTIATSQMKVTDSNVDKYNALFVVPHISAWVPNPTDFKPFARVGYAVYGTIAGSGKTAAGVDVAEAYTATGLWVGAGVKYSILPLVAAILEYQIFNPKVKVNKLEVAGTDFSSAVDTPTLSTSTILLGVEAGI